MHSFKPSFSFRLARKIRRLPIEFFQTLRIFGYKLLSDARNVSSLAHSNQPVLMTGLGKIDLRKCSLGVWPSPYFLNGYMHIEARNPGSEIFIGNGVFINNNAVIIADRSRISIGENTLIGTEFTVYDSDFHELHPEGRMNGLYETASVEIGDNVFIGSRVTVLKGVAIGDNSVIAAGSLVSKSIPSYVIAGGVPARIIKSIKNEIS